MSSIMGAIPIQNMTPAAFSIAKRLAILAVAPMRQDHSDQPIAVSSILEGWPSRLLRLRKHVYTAYTPNMS